ncbi:hypothetical protein OB13_02825 [Pontibacter sp. HJ8]
MKKTSPSIQAPLSFILAELNTSEEKLRAQGIHPEELVNIYNDYLTRQAELNGIAAYTSNTIMKARGVHAVRYRVKDPVHLLQKIIRKKAEYPERVINQQNYLQWINDLAGVRVLYLYKESWSGIGRYIQEVWELKRPPVAYIGNDDGLLVREFAEAGCTIRQHHLGYKAVHFVIRTQPNRQAYFVEVQLRTLFEEGWSEVDHTIRYPEHTCNAFVRELLTILNHLTGQADAVAGFMRKLLPNAPGHTQILTLLTNENRTRLKAHIKKLPIAEAEKQRLYTCLDNMPGTRTGT